MDKPNKKLDQVLEGYKPIPMRTRMFYPRGFKLSENFVNSFHEEYDRLVGEGLNPKNLLERFGKALRFHVTEKRCYRNPVVEGGLPGNPLPEENKPEIQSQTVAKKRHFTGSLKSHEQEAKEQSKKAAKGNASNVRSPGQT